MSKIYRVYQPLEGRAVVIEFDQFGYIIGDKFARDMLAYYGTSFILSCKTKKVLNTVLKTAYKMKMVNTRDSVQFWEAA